MSLLHISQREGREKQREPRAVECVDLWNPWGCLHHHKQKRREQHKREPRGQGSRQGGPQLLPSRARINLNASCFHSPHRAVIDLDRLAGSCTGQYHYSMEPLHPMLSPQLQQSCLCSPSGEKRPPLYSECAVVGASGSLLEAPAYGAEIDAHAGVFRLAATISGWNASIAKWPAGTLGNRTTIMVLREGEVKRHKCTAASPDVLVVLSSFPGCSHWSCEWSCARTAPLSEALRLGGCRHTFAMRAEDGMHLGVMLGTAGIQPAMATSRWSSGAQMALAALALCRTTHIYGFDPPTLNAMSAHERVAQGLWPYHFFDSMEPGMFTDLHGIVRRLPRHIANGTGHAFKLEYDALCGRSCHHDGVLEYRFPSMNLSRRSHLNGCACTDAELSVQLGRLVRLDGARSPQHHAPIAYQWRSETADAHDTLQHVY
jgi:hypothetical protein